MFSTTVDNLHQVHPMAILVQCNLPVNAIDTSYFTLLPYPSSHKLSFSDSDHLLLFRFNSTSTLITLQIGPSPSSPLVEVALTRLIFPTYHLTRADGSSL